MGESIRVLYVTDGLETARARARALERANDITVDIETTAGDAIELRPDAFDCVVADGVDAPAAGESATECSVFHAVREAAPELPVVLVADAVDSGVETAIVPGVDTEANGDRLLVDRVRAAVDGTAATSTESHTRLRAETFPDVAFYIDGDGRYVDIIAGREETLLYDDPEQLMGERLQDVLPPETAKRLQETIERALDTGEVQTIQYQLDVTAGQRWFEGRVAPVDHGTDQVLLVARDITTRKEREAALEALHGMATTIQTAETVEQASELTVAAAADILDFEMCNVTIREGDWLVPYAMSEEAQPDGARTMHVEEGLAGKTFQTGESYVVDQVRPDDETSPTFESIQSGLSVPIGEYGVFQAVSAEPRAFDKEDITLAELLVSHTTTAIDRIERERTLTHKTERLEEFASFVSHDLRNPLNVATLRLELAREECNSKHLEGLEGALDRMERLIEELLALARQGETIGETEAVQLADLVSRAWDNVETNGATLDCRTDLTLYADRTRLTSVLENLVRNAIEHGGDEVTVTVGDLDDGTGFYVADDGPGIPESEGGQIFESGYSTAPDGTGFGLTIVRDIVEAHGWAIRVTESETGGARFEVTGVERIGND